MRDPVVYGWWLWAFTFLFFLRVIGQVIVVLRRPRWLPPMEQWYSGLMPYRYLLPAQALFLAVMITICVQFSAGGGFFVAPLPRAGTAALWFSYFYFGSMVGRYAIRMKRRPDQRWLGGTIPIVFHCVLAAFLFAFGRFHAP
jgi:hypothetical protein